MKRLLFVLFALFSVVMAAAQPPFGPPPGGFGGPQQAGGDGKRDNAKRYEYVKEGLKMDDETFKKFIPVYSAYLREIQGVDKDLKKYVDSFTDEELDAKVAKKVAMARLDAQMEHAKVRKEYLRAFIPYLTPDQILKVFSLERRRDGKRPPRDGKPPHGGHDSIRPPYGGPDTAAPSR